MEAALGASLLVGLPAKGLESGEDERQALRLLLGRPGNNLSFLWEAAERQWFVFRTPCPVSTETDRLQEENMAVAHCTILSRQSLFPIFLSGIFTSGEDGQV